MEEQPKTHEAEATQSLLKPFNVATVSRVDLVLAGLAQDVALSLTDEDMQTIAGAIAGYYDNHVYWNALRIETNKMLDSKDTLNKPFHGTE